MRLWIVTPLQLCHGSTPAGCDIRECEGVRNLNLDSCMEAEGGASSEKAG